MPARNFFFILLSLYSGSAFAQGYFQQEVKYKIEVRLDDVKHELFANESIIYTNNSPAELNYIWFHLWPNAYKNTATAFAEQNLENGSSLFYFSREEDKGTIDQLDFKVNGKPVLLLQDSVSIDVAKIILNEPLKPGASVTITTPFHVKIPNGMFSRMGHEGQQYQITQWYPKPAVYDKEGWHPISYLDQGEFYSEFGSFDVALTLPKNYVVGATGELQDEEEKQWINERAMVCGRLEAYPKTDSFPQSDSQNKTIHYRQDRIHDFAWFCDKRYNVLKSEVELPHTHHKVLTWVLFTNGQAKLWKSATQYVNDALYNYSLWIGDYPYANCTAVDGALSAGGGMEYPNITVINATADAITLDEVITHEVGHNWFYGMLGSNERRHAWMDEGINTFYENRYMKKKYPDANVFGFKPKYDLFDVGRYSRQYESYIAYELSAAKNEDQPCDISSEKYTKLNYGGDVYEKTGMILTYLMDYLGQEKMDQCMQAYFEAWKFKHPQPADFRAVVEPCSSATLNWFFDDLLETTKKLDYKMQACSRNKDGTWKLVLQNTGQIKGPVVVGGIRNDSVLVRKWFEGFEGEASVDFPAGNFDRFKIDPDENMPEVNRDNNSMRTSGLFKKEEPLQLQPLISFDNPDKTQIYFCPTAGWNNYNKLMLGMAFYNITLPEKRFEYMLDPMYGTGANPAPGTGGKLAGYGNFTFNFHPNRVFQKISIGVDAARFGYSDYPQPFIENYTKIAPQIGFIFKNKDPRSSIKNSLRIRSVSVVQDNYTADYSISPPVYSEAGTHYTINQATFTSSNTRIINPCRLVLDLQENSDFVKASLEAMYTLTYKGRKKGLDIRFFAGKFLNNSGPAAGNYSFRTAGWNGSQDYLYDNIFLGRTETSGVLSQQFVETDGGFKAPVFVGETTNWLMALNLKSSLPGPLSNLPVRIYSDFAITDPSARLTNTLLYEAGIDICIAKDIFEIYLPIPALLCKDFQNEFQAPSPPISYKEQIRFTLNLNLLNPFTFIQNIKF